MLLQGRAIEASPGAIQDVLRVGLDATPDEIAVVSSARELTWRELDERSAALGARYRALGLRRGDRLASLMPNRLDLLVHYLACFRAGLVATPLNYRYTARELDHALRVSEASALVVHAERAEDLAASRLVAALPLGTIACEGTLPDAAHRLERLIEGPAQPLEEPPPSPDEPVAIFFTSGSTGPAKGVTHTHGSIAWMAASAMGALELTADDVVLPASSMSHVGSFLWTLAALSAGARIVLARSYDARELLPLLRGQQPTVMAILPAALAALVRDHGLAAGDLGSLRLCRVGADKVSTELFDEFHTRAGLSIDEGYGMTEVGLATVNPPSGVIKRGSIGVPVPGCAVSLRDDDGAEVRDSDTVGRIWIRTRSRMAGYWRDPDATAAIVEDDWLDSGDLARADDDGYLWFFGRKKQIIVHDGSNISPGEVEEALAEHPAIALAGVVGVHDLVHGENVRAYVTLREEAAPPTSDELIRFCRERVGYKAPEEVVVLDAMPLNPTGKLDRVRLRALAEEHLHHTHAPAS